MLEERRVDYGSRRRISPPALSFFMLPESLASTAAVCNARVLCCPSECILHMLTWYASHLASGPGFLACPSVKSCRVAALPPVPPFRVSLLLLTRRTTLK